MNSKTEAIKQLAKILLKSFGYQNVSREQITLVDYDFYQGRCDYIIISFEAQLLQFSYDSDGETRSWKLLVRK